MNFQRDKTTSLSDRVCDIFFLYISFEGKFLFLITSYFFTYKFFRLFSFLLNLNFTGLKKKKKKKQNPNIKKQKKTKNIKRCESERVPSHHSPRLFIPNMATAITAHPEHPRHSTRP